MEEEIEVMYDLINAKQFCSEKLKEWLEKAKEFERYLLENPTPQLDILHGVKIASLYFEPSTRTRLCLETAAINLGAIVRGAEDPAIFSAMAAGKEESFGDTFRIISGFKSPHLRIADIVIIRHPGMGAAKKAAYYSDVPVLNAGDKDNHPIQALTDQLAFDKFLGGLNNLTIAFVGDLKNSRIIEDNVVLLSYNPGFTPIFVAPKGLEVKERIKTFLRKKGITFYETSNIKEVIRNCHAGYIVRVQKNRIKDPRIIKAYQEHKDDVSLTLDVYRMTEKSGTIFFHPMPVSEVEQEIRPDVALLDRVKMYQQALLKIPIGMVALTELWQTHQAKQTENATRQ